eukprot:SAG11_NODE_6199_length_1366_cov_3.453039_1_plen_274_part_00
MINKPASLLSTPPQRCLTQWQREALVALVDTFMPALSEEAVAAVQGALSPSAACDMKLVPEFLRTAGSQSYVCESIETAIAQRLTQAERLELTLLLTALSTRLGSALVLCCSPHRAAFSQRPLAERDAALLWLSRSYLGVHRKAFLALKRLILALCLSAVDSANQNSFWPAIRYTPIGTTQPKPATNELSAGVEERTAAIRQQLLPLPDDGASIEYDIVIVGSGAGGGVAAAALASAGHSILVLEKGQYIEPAQVTTLEKDGFDQMYEKAGCV